MSWQDDLNNIQFEIITGDRKVWRPLLTQNYEKNIEYSGFQYEFIGRVGSLFARRLPKGRSYPLEFAFTGENNTKNANAFELSARDYRAWKVTHPFYGEIQVQPLSLKIVSNGLNSTLINCQVIESSDALQPTEYPDYLDLLEMRLLAAQLAAQNMFENPLTISAKELQLATNTIDDIGTRVSILAKLDSEFKEFQSNLNNALNELNNAMAITIGFITYAQQLINLPATVASNIGTRFAMLKDTLESLKSNIEGVATVGYFEKLFYNLMGATVVSSMAKAVSTQNTGDFETKTEVNLYVEKLITEYESYLSTLYGLESADFIPNHDLAFATHTLICETVANLYQVMFAAKQERIVILEKDSNLIILAHRFYGIASEENISKLKSTNKIGLSEILNIKKDRQIKYYV